MSFLKKFIPLSPFAYFAIGFLLSSSMLFFYTLNIFEALAIFFILFLLRSEKLGLVLLGFLICFVLQFLRVSLAFKKPETLFERDFKSIQFQRKDFQLKIIKEIRAGYYLSEISVQSFQAEVIVRAYSKDFSRYSYSCNSANMKFSKLDRDFLLDYNFYFIDFKEKNCDAKMNDSIRDKFKEGLKDLLIENGFQDRVLNIALGLLLGNSNYLDRDFKESVREGGLLHLFAASGLHIGILISFLFFFTKRIRFFNYYTEKIFPIFIGFLYLVLLNFPISLERAFLFVFILFLSGIFFRKSKSIDLLLLTGFFIAILNPENLKTISFQLSFSAVFGILLFKENLDRIFFGKMKNILTENFSISLSAMIGTYLVLIFYFKSFSFGSLLINFCIVPIASILLPLLYLTIFIGYSVKLLNMIPFLEYINEPFWFLSNQLIEFLAYLSILFSEKISFQKESTQIDLEIYLVFFAFLFFLVALFFCSEVECKKKKRFYAILISLSSFFTLGSFLILSYYLFDLKFEKIYKTVFASYDYFLVKEKNSIYLGGTCKYSKHQLQKNLNRKFCRDADQIHVEEESCLSFALKCNQYFQSESKPKLYSIPSQDLIDEVENIKEKFPKKFDFYFFYYPNKDSLSNLIANTKDAKGRIVIFFPYKSKDSAKDWNQNKNLLGISPNWNFITFDEL